MRFSTLLPALSAVAGGLAQRGGIASRGIEDSPFNIDSDTTHPAPKRYIMEFVEGTNQKELIDQINSREGTKVLKVFNSDVFRGVSVETDTENTDSLLAINEVAQVWKSNLIKLEPTISGESFSDDAAAPEYSVHNMTGVDKLHAAGIYGKGVVIAVIDTGIQYTHPALGGGFGPGFKVAGGYDFVGPGTWPIAPAVKEPDTDPMDILGHGTHVAGIIAGKSDFFTGVAPEATLLAYKVFGQVASTPITGKNILLTGLSQDGTDEDTLIEAFLMAYEADVDIITASIGAASGWSTNAWAVLASRLVEKGVVVTIAAGNNGLWGPFFISNGAAGENVIAVASTEASTIPAQPFSATFSLDGQSNVTTVAYIPGVSFFPPSVKNWPIIPLTLDTAVAADACDPLPEDTGDLSKIIPLVRVGGCDIMTKQSNLAPFNASYIIFYNDEGPVADIGSWYDFSLLGLIEEKAGKAIIATVAAGGSVTADFSAFETTNYVGMYNAIGGKPSYFTSWGSTFDLFLKPDIAAPGSRILSTFPTDAYKVYSGTSMATPYVAGVAALYVGYHGGRKTHGPGFAKDLAGRIIGSGRAIKWSDGTATDFGFWAPTIQVGNGLIDAFKVINYSTSLSFTKFNLNDTHHFSRHQKVDITNSGSETVTYKFSIQDAGGFESWKTEGFGSPRVNDGSEGMPPFKIVPKVKFPAGTFKLKPGETKKAEFIFSIPEGLNSSNIPVYSGKVLISGSNGDQLSVPYFGVGSDLKEVINDVFTIQWGYPFSYSTTSLIDIDEKPFWTFNLSLDAQDFPKVFLRLVWGTKELRWDIFESNWSERNWKYPPIVGKDGYVGSVAYWPLLAWDFDPAIQNPDLAVAFPLADRYRDVEFGFYWLGKLANGSQIAPGNYKMRLAALSPFGNPEAANNWDVWKVPPISVLPL